MRRISTLAILFAVAAPCAARSYVPERYKTRYSPYAWKYGHSGLVHGGVQYSPYAYSYGNTGLVYENVRYSPYGWGYGHTGLIADYGGYGPYYYWGGPRYPDCVDYGRHVGGPGCPEPRCPVAGQAMPGCYFQQTAPAEPRPSAPKPKPAPLNRQDEPTELIRKFLEATGAGRCRITDQLRIGDKTLSASFVLGDKNLIIKYWHPDAAETLAGQSDSRKTYFEKYKQDWQDHSARFRQAGGSVYNVTAADNESILLSLELCPQLDRG